MTGALTLADYPARLVRVAFRKCNRRARHWRATSVALYGGTAPFPDGLAHLAQDCPNRRGKANSE